MITHRAAHYDGQTHPRVVDAVLRLGGRQKRSEMVSCAASGCGQTAQAAGSSTGGVGGRSAVEGRSAVWS